MAHALRGPTGPSTRCLPGSASRSRPVAGLCRCLPPIVGASTCSSPSSDLTHTTTPSSPSACRTAAQQHHHTPATDSVASASSRLKSCAEASTSGAAWGFVAGVTAAGSLALLLPAAACASGGGEALSGSALDVFKSFLDGVEALGPWGGFVFVVTVMFAEMIPLFPTQPLTLASGLIFGGKQGALLVLLGVTLAAVNAFYISRGVGRPLAEKVIQYEMGEGGGNGVARKIQEVQQAIEAGGFWQQFTAILLLRLTPVVPFSASNYMLGLTPVQLPAFVGGTLAGMSVWSVLYASLGGASRSLLDNGMDIGTLLLELAEDASAMTKPVLLGALAVAAIAGGVYLAGRSSSASSSVAPEAGAAEVVQHAKEEASVPRK